MIPIPVERARALRAVRETSGIQGHSSYSHAGRIPLSPNLPRHEIETAPKSVHMSDSACIRVYCHAKNLLFPSRCKEDNTRFRVHQSLVFLAVKTKYLTHRLALPVTPKPSIFDTQQRGQHSFLLLCLIRLSRSKPQRFPIQPLADCLSKLLLKFSVVSSIIQSTCPLSQSASSDSQTGSDERTTASPENFP